MVTVKGTGSTWTNNSSLLVGHKGKGTLTIEAGGSVSNTEGFIAELEGSTGEVTVSGAGSTWTNSVNLYVGGHDSTAGGTGTLTVDSGGLVKVAGTTTVWQPGTVNLHDGALQTQWLRNYGNVILSQSTVNGRVTNRGTITAVGEVAFNDPVGGAGNFFGPGTVSFNGEFSPGASPANVAFEGNLVLAETNTLFIEIGGTTPGSEHDVLTIAGSATLDGILDVSLIDGFRPALGQQFTILTAQSILDNGITLVGNAAGYFDLLVNDSSAILQTTSAGLPGDFNGDGTVTAADYTVWRDGLGASFADSHYTQWKNNFGARVPPGVGHSTRAAVPEPGTIVLWALAAILLVNRPVTKSAAA